MADDTQTLEKDDPMAAAMAAEGDDPMAAAMADDPMAAAMAADGDDPMAAAMGAGGDDPMAAAMGGDGTEGEGDEEQARVLNQDEIDLLLGFDSAEDGMDRSTGIYAILDKSMMAYEKLPMLEVVFDRLVRSLSSSLRNFTSDNVDVSIDSMVSLRFDDYLNSISLPAMLVVFRAVEWENFGLVTIDSAQIYSTVDILLGGRRATSNMRIEGRPYTTIEQDIVKKMIDVILNDMSEAFDPLSPVTFTFDRLESNPRFTAIARPNSAALLVRLRVDMEERGGVIELLFPHATLEPIRDLLLQMFMGEKFGQDSVWERHLGREVGQTFVEMEAVLEERTMALGEVVDFQIGSTIMLDAEPDDAIVVRSGGVHLTTAQVGRVGERVAIAVNEEIKDYRKKLREMGQE